MDAEWATWRSDLYPRDWTPGDRDAEGRGLQDFSYAGYHRGERPLPDAGADGDVDAVQYGADPEGVEDATDAIQEALDEVGEAGGGVVALPPGTFRLSAREGGRCALELRHDGVVLRGAGPAETRLVLDEPDFRAGAMLRAGPPECEVEGLGATPVGAWSTPTAARSASTPRSGITSSPATTRGSTGFARTSRRWGSNTSRSACARTAPTRPGASHATSTTGRTTSPTTGTTSRGRPPTRSTTRTRSGSSTWRTAGSATSRPTGRTATTTTSTSSRTGSPSTARGASPSSTVPSAAPSTRARGATATASA